MFEIKGKYTTAKVMIDDVEASAKLQLEKMADNYAFTNPVSAMPDIHAGAGCVIGFTMLVGEFVVPNVIGYDIGCGVLSYPIGYSDINFEWLDGKIRSGIPFGNKVRIPELHQISEEWVNDEITGFGTLCSQVGMDYDRAICSVGTLGSGNHFIEIGKSENDGQKWVTIHTGSRQLGQKTCKYWQGLAVDNVRTKGKKEYAAAVDEMLENTHPMNRDKRHQELKDKFSGLKSSNGLEALSGDEKDGYLIDMVKAQEYASLNRKVILLDILNILRIKNFRRSSIIESVHNYIDPDDNIIRKGAIRSYTGELMVIPWNMGEGVVIAEGKSNPEWNYSAPHGAGRKMSRTDAKKKLDKEVEERKMVGIFATKLPLDELPGAYKDSKVVEGLLGPTATILDRIKPLHVMKDGK